jgi:hypothetical protein
MNRGEIKVDHCYSMTAVNGRRTITRVTNLFKITAMAAQEEIGTETLELNPCAAGLASARSNSRSHWRRSRSGAATTTSRAQRASTIHVPFACLLSPAKAPPSELGWLDSHALAQ